MKKLFGTDGVRGYANKELTPKLAFELGRSVGMNTREHSGKSNPVFLIGKDTRVSGSMFEMAIASGLMSVNCNVVFLSHIPTPAVAYMVKELSADVGVVISASHNPYYDNGIKFFDADGYKFSDERESDIEKRIADNFTYPEYIDKKIGVCYADDRASRDYIDKIKNTFDNVDLSGLKIVLDCANGATFAVAPALFKELNVEVTTIFNMPNGMNINDNCGSTHIQALQEEVLAKGADVGFAFDGDGDRLICVDEKGNEVDGDGIMYILAQKLKAEGKLNKDTLVITTMSNLGLITALEKEGIRTVQTDVGDKHIVHEMQKEDYSFGGEQSGHIIIKECNTTGDGIATATLLAKVLKESAKPFSSLLENYKKFPQTLINVKVESDKKLCYKDNAKVLAFVDELNAKYQSTGRVLLRHSGTEPVVRVMIEGQCQDEIEKDALMLSEIVREVSL